MSMLGCFISVSDADIDALLARPKRVELLIFGQYLTNEKKGIFSFFMPKKEPETDNWKPENNGEDFDIDKAWHGIHFLLTGSAWEGKWPEGFILTGGAQIGDIDVGYGPARAFRSAEVVTIANTLNGISRDMLMTKCDKQDFFDNEIYPEIWDEEPEECFGYLMEHFDGLKEFINKAAGNKHGLIVYIG